jgi:hypothetical protein
LGEHLSKRLKASLKKTKNRLAKRLKTNEWQCLGVFKKQVPGRD